MAKLLGGGTREETVVYIQREALARTTVPVPAGNAMAARSMIWAVLSDVF